ncbi:MAG TPA: TlpA disulfide reductase family protein [Candidatus Binatia bacterium]|nr:TlpA disulfide reductase family protein [Candidatus Binatia bacterium]
MKLGPVLALSLSLCLSGAPVWAQGKVNYKQLVPNLEAMKDNSPTPDFTLADPSGKKATLKEYRGKLVLLNFWATWCVPCREEMPAMERLYQQFKDKGFTIVAVNIKDSKKDAFAFLKELKITYPIMLDPDGEVGLLYGAWGLPTTYLIGPKGEGLARLWGPAAWDGAGAKHLIQDLLDGKR